MDHRPALRPIGGRLSSIGGRVMGAGTPMLAAIQSVGAEVVVLGLNVLTGMITARLLGPEGRGIFAAVTLWQQLVAMVAIAGLQSAAIYHARRPGLDPRDVAGAAAVAALASATLVALPAALLIPRLMAGYADWAIAAALACLLIAHVNALHMIFKQAFAAASAYARYNLVSVLSPALFLAALVLAAILAPMTAGLAIAALAAACCAALAITAALWWRRVRPRFTRLWPTMRAMAPFTLRSAPGDAVTALAANVDRLVLIPLVSGASLGLYVVAYSFSRLLLVLRPAIDAVVFSSMADRDPEAMARLHDRAFRVALSTLVLALVPLFAIDRVLLGFLYGAEFEAAAHLFRILAAEAALGLLAGITMRYLMASGLPSLVSGFQIGGLALSVGLMLWLVPRHGVEGAALSVAIATGVKLAGLLVALPATGRALPDPILRREDLRFIRDRLG